uniref:Upstream transcription factor family member 3 n=1 Tax=Hippocampus comes TaxID=109280 RepID=A0A3Q3E7Q4_HIPCM
MSPVLTLRSPTFPLLYSVERHRKEKINAGINRIGNLLPCSQALKQSKNMILDQAFRYITELKKQNDTLLLEGGDKVQAEEIRRLRHHCEELRKESAHYIQLLKAHDINFLEDPTVHWKGKRRCAKVAKVTPTHQLPKGIIVYSNGNVTCPAGKESAPGKQPSETIILQPPLEVSASVRVNGALLQVTTSAASLHSGSSVAQSTAGLALVEQRAVEKTPQPPSVSYITLQLPAVNAGLPHPPAASAQTNVAPISASPLPLPVSCLATINQTVRDTALRTVSYTGIPNSQALLRAGAAGSTQTTWTTLQMAGNTVQPVCQSLGSTTQAVRQVTVCPVGAEPPPVQQIQIQMQPPPAPAQQAAVTAHIQANPPQLRPAVPTQSAVLRPASLVPHPSAALIPRAQPQAAVLPLLQTMQVLQVKASGAAATAPQSSNNNNNPSVVILQQANSCPSQPVMREEASNPAPCQHIVIIQASNHAAPAPQNPNLAPATQTPNSSTLQSVGGKQLVHILPRPAQPPVSHSSQTSQTPAGVHATPQTITVNGQVFALKTMKTSDKTASQSTIQLVQPNTTEEPTTNVALKSLGALSSLNQSISQGLPLSISSQSNNSGPPAATPSAAIASPASDVPPVAAVTESAGTVQRVTSPQSPSKTVACVTSSGPTVLNQPPPKSVGSVGANADDVVSSQASAVATVSAASVAASAIGAAAAANDKAAAASNGSLAASKPVERETTGTVTRTTQSNSALPSTVSKSSATVFTAVTGSDVANGATAAHAARPPSVCATAIVPATQSTQSLSCPQQLNNIKSVPCGKEPASSSAASTTSTPSSSVGACTTRRPDPSVKLPPAAPAAAKTRQAQEASPATSLASSTSDTTQKKDFVLSHGVYTNLDDQTLEPPVTDSPMSTVAGGGRGFSVASMLPQGQDMSASSGSFGTFTFTSEQAEMLALAMLEQDSESGKSQVSIRGQGGDGSVSGTGGSRHPQNPAAHLIAYSQSQSLPQVQTQSSAQSGTVASLSVNNLIRPSSSQQPFPGSPSLAGQQCSVPSPAAAAASVHISQSSNNTLSPCSGAGQLNEYAPMKTALMRAQAERQVKILSKRQAQEEVMLNGGKRPKACPAPAPAVGHMDVKGADHGQMMVGQMPPSSRINSEGSLFSTNSFMSTVVRSTDAHCPPEQNQPGVLHPPQGHPQHPAAQHLGGNLYMKQQQQEQQRHHLYHLQHHLTQPDAAQRHSLHQRALQQEQHAQKKRGLVRGSQSGSPAAAASHPQQHQVPAHQQQHQQQQQHHQQLQQQQQNSHSRHQQHLQQQIQQQQQQQQHFRHQEKSCEQQLISPSNPASRSSELSCTPSRQERHRVSNYSAEALIGKSTTSADQQQQQRMAHHLPPSRGGTAPEQGDLRGYMDASGRGKANVPHNPQGRIPSDHPGPNDIQRVSECLPFKSIAAGPSAHQLAGFEAQVSRGSDMAAKPQRAQLQQGTFRMGAGPPPDGRNRVSGGYAGVHLGPQGAHVGPALLREQEACHQSFMQSLLSPEGNHQRTAQCCPPVSMEYPSVDIQVKASSPSQKASAMNKSHISQVNTNMHGGVRAAHPAEPGRPSAPSRPPVSQHSRHAPPAKLRPGERPRPGTLRPGNPFEPEGHLPLPSGGGVLLGRTQSGGEARRSAIVRFMADGTQAPGDNNLVAEQHLAQNFGFPFIPEGGMNPPINANSTFIPPVSQPNASSRTPSLLPVEPQNTLPSFYPSYSPAAHPSLPGDVTLQYFSNQMFTSPGPDKPSAPPPLNNRFGSILSPPRAVGFAQASFPLLPDMPPMPIANSSGITPHISNFSLTSLFPEIAAGMPTDGSAMPMSPLLSLANASAADSGKQPNRPAHNISHILGHDGSSAV